MKEFEKLGVSESLLKFVRARKFEHPTEIQEKSIPLILKGKDVIAGSATGSGKTLAFGAGIVEVVEKGKGVQSLVLAPTRELAEQVSEEIREFSYSKGLEVVSVYGGVSIDNQIKKLAYANVVVATPGRLLDHMNRKSIDLSRVSFLVLDEADRMWDMGFQEDVSKIVRNCPKNRQTLLFSATITPELSSFSEKYMKRPVEIQVENYVDASKLKQIYYDVRDDEKFSFLVYLLKNENAGLVMIFCNTRTNADFVAKNLKLNGVDAQAIHGGLSQAKRDSVLKRFDNSTVNVLVCTDVAARGLDIEGISHVYNYDVPSDAKDYVHRIGRTARAGAEGIAVNIVASRDYDNFYNVQKNNREINIERVDTPKFPRVSFRIERREGRGKRGQGRGRGPGNSRRGRSSGETRRGSGMSSNSRFGRRRSDSRGRQNRGERNKRSNKPREGFRGGGRNTRRKFSRR